MLTSLLPLLRWLDDWWIGHVGAMRRLFDGEDPFAEADL